MLVEITPADDVGVAAYVALDNACTAADRPWEVSSTPDRLRNEMRYGWDGEVARYFLVTVADEAVGTVCLYAPEQENPDLLWVEIRIAPGRRRQGHGRAALAAAEGLARDVRRPLVVLEGGLDEPAARGFAARAGYPLSQVTVRRVHDLDGSLAQRTHLEALRAEAAATSSDYDVHRYAGRVPDEVVDRLVAAVAAINDAPTDDLEYEDEVYDVDRVRRFEQAQSDAGFRLYRAVAVHRKSGEVAGHTVVSVYSDAPEHAEQDDTTVVARHRGHQLGLRLKTEMALWLGEVEPQVRSLLTENAESNDAMVQVNERLGYRVAARQLLFQRRLD